MRRITALAGSFVVLALAAPAAPAHVVDGTYRSDVTAENCGQYDACGSGQSSGSSSGSSSSSSGGALGSIAQCESGGDPTAVSPDGQYRGLLQFDQQTWESVGGSGDPAAASSEEQLRRGAMLQEQRGSSPWPTCG